MKKYTIGLDFGTLSARAVMLDTADGSDLGVESVFVYPHGVMTEVCGKTLPEDYALQDPADYEAALEFLLCDIVKKSGAEPHQIVGIGIDFTSCTVLPVDKDCRPLCEYPEYKNEPHAYVKLWKHHGAEKYLDKINAAVATHGGDMLDCCGGVMASEFMIPKLYETFAEAPQVYSAAHRFLNAGDFAVSLLCGEICSHSTAYAVIKENYDESIGGYPPRAFFESLGEGFGDVIEQKLGRELSVVGSRVGGLSPEWAQRCGLLCGVAVAAPLIDAQSSLAAAGIYNEGALLVLGTSAVLVVNTDSKNKLRGVLSQGLGSAAPNIMTLEAGLAAMGDLFAWFVDNCVPESYTRAAKEKGMSIHAYLRSLAENKKVGENGLIALDWWNGNRSVIQNNRLSGMIIGLRISTPPEDIYRALIESTAYGLRRVLENYTEQGVKVGSIAATGGIAYKDEMLMQIFADVFGRDIGVLASPQSASHGAAIYGAAAASVYDSVSEAFAKMRCPVMKTYSPDAESAAVYERIYGEYKKLYDYFGNNASLTELLWNK